MARKSRFLVAALAATLCSSAYALGLGGIEARSSLNQPLSARIPLHAVQADELEQVNVRLASGEAFSRAGIERSFHLSRLRFEVVNDGGAPQIRVSTREPVKEPFLDFLIEVSWPRGRMVREYTVLLDPPVYSSEQRAAPALPAVPVRSADAGRPAAGARAAAAPSAPSAFEEAAATTGASGGGQYTVRDGDTLWRVAQNTRPDNAVSVHQAMLALLRANPDAFAEGDPNRLRRGSLLRVPEREEMVQVGNNAAFREIHRLLAAHRQPAPVAPAPAAPAESPVAAPSENEGRLQIVAAGEDEQGSESASTGGDGAGEGAEALRGRLLAMEEAQQGLESENEELKAQLAALQAELAGLERMVNIQAEATAEEAGSSQVPEADLAAETASEAVAAPVSSAMTPVEPVAEPEGLELLLQDTRTLSLLLGVALALAGLGWLVVRRRRALARAPVTVTFDTPEHDTAPLSDAARAAAATADSGADDEDVTVADVLSEADVYLAYGRYDQAEAAVVQALAEEPSRADLRAKLLEIYALTHNRAGFEEEAARLHEQVGEEDVLWQRALEMGREIAPDHSLFAEAPDEAEVATTEQAEERAPLLGDAELFSDANETAEASGEVSAQPVEEFGLDFEFETSPKSVESQQASEYSLDFDLELPTAAEREPEAAAPVDEDGGLEALEPLEPDFALDDAGEASDAVALGDAVGTKLDLARAYLDMGDQEGARELLNEVLQEGSAEQQSEAQGLLKQAS